MVGELFLVAVTATCTAAAVAIVTGSKVDAAPRRAAAAEHRAAMAEHKAFCQQAVIDQYEKPAREFAGHDCHWP